MMHKLDILAGLADEIATKRDASPETSYTAKLIAAGVEKCAKKFGEEAVEAALASVSEDRTHLAAEAADVLYHLLVLLEAAKVPVSDVMDELARRRGVGGLAEKASRKQD
jgi:phosphoribosyl-ATP pyrophosphohydrolase